MQSASPDDVIWADCWKETTMTKPRKSGIDKTEEEIGGRHLFISLIAGLALIVIGMIIVFAIRR
jgi:hypothetical protein